MKISFVRQGWRTLWRDLRAGELRLLIVAVTLAVAALTAVGFFADRLKGGLQRDARQLLGGDAVLSSDLPTPAAFEERSRALGLQSATTLGFPTMGRASDAQGGASRLVALKAVQAGYPLRGRLQVADRPEAEGLPHARRAGAGRGLGRRAAARRAEPEDGRFPTAGRRAAAHRTHHRGRTRPRRRLHELRAARDDEPGRSADHPADPARQPPHLPLRRGRRRGAGARLLRMGAAGDQEARDPRRAPGVAGKRPARDAPDHGPRREVPEPGGAAGRAAQRGSGGAGGARLRCQPPGRLRHAARAGPEPAHHRAGLHLRVRIDRPVRQPAGCGAGLRGALRLRAAAGGPGGGGAARGQLLAGGLRCGHGADAAVRLRPAAGAATRAGAGAARDPARRRRPQTGFAGRAGPGRRRLCRLADGCQQRLAAGPHRGGWLRRRSAGVRGPELRGGEAASAQRQRDDRAALAGAGHAPDFGAPGLCRGAGQRAGRRPAGAGAAGAAAHRSDRQLAQGHAGRRAQPLRHQHHAGAGRRLPQDLGGRRRGPLRLVSDDPRPAGGRERPHGLARRLHRRPRQAPGGPRVQPLAQRRAARTQPAGGRRLDAPRRPAPSAWKRASPRR